MVCVFPFWNGDVKQALDLLRWIRTLGGTKNHDALLVIDEATNWDSAYEASQIAWECFKSVTLVSNGQSVVGWPKGPNSLWLTAAKYCNDNKLEPWLFLETDALPLKSTFLDDLEARYAASDGNYLGAIMPCTKPGLPKLSLSGVACYPHNAFAMLGDIVNANMDKAFDMTIADIVVPQSDHTELIHHLWGEKDKPPVFAEKGIPHTEVFGLDQIKKEAVIFHRNKDGSLMRLLKKRMGIVDNYQEIAVVFAWCRKDCDLMAKSMEWIAELSPSMPRTAVLHYDNGIQGDCVYRISKAAHAAFKTVLTSRYPVGRSGNIGWPMGCNYSFREACKFIANKVQKPFLWFESDAVAVRKDWIYRLEDEYAKGGKPFMGFIIESMGHFNGTAIYPPDVMRYAPSIATCKIAWDVAIKNEVLPHTHKASKTLYHCRTIINGKGADINGQPPTFRSAQLVQSVIPPETAFFHPCKDGSLIDWLRVLKHQTQ